MPGGTGLDKFQTELPDMFFDVGICEQHAVTFAAGLACEGLKPVCAIYSTFLQRAFDQIVHDVCIQNLPVVFCLDRSGVVGNDGETHQGVFDIAYLRALPNIVIMSPKDENELRNMLATGIDHDGPIAIRYPRGNAVGVEFEKAATVLLIGKAEVLCRGTDALCIAFGPIASSLLELANNLRTEFGINITVINSRFAKPLDYELLKAEIPLYKTVLTVEDHSLSGGFGSAVVEFINDSGIAAQCAVQRFGVGDSFVPHGSQEEQCEMHGYDIGSIREYILSVCSVRSLAVG